MNLVNDIKVTTDDYKHINCIIEIPKGTNTKYEYNEELYVFEFILYGLGEIQQSLSAFF